MNTTKINRNCTKISQKQANKIWEELAVKRQKEICGEHWFKLAPRSKDTPESTKNYIIKSINEMIAEKQATIPQRTYSSKSMSEIEKANFLVTETDKIIFPDNSQIFSMYIYDEYDYSDGIAGLLEIINNFVHWTDVS